MWYFYKTTYFNLFLKMHKWSHACFICKYHTEKQIRTTNYFPNRDVPAHQNWKYFLSFGLFLNTFIYPFQLLLFFLCNSIRRSDFSSLHGVKPYSYQKQKFEKQKDDTKELDSHTQHSNQKNDLKIMLKRFKISKCLRYFWTFLQDTGLISEVLRCK